MKTEQKYNTHTKIKDNPNLKKNGEIKEQINYLFKKGKGLTPLGKKQLKINDKKTGDSHSISVKNKKEKNEQKDENKDMANEILLKIKKMKIKNLNEFNETCRKIMLYSHMVKKESEKIW